MTQACPFLDGSYCACIQLNKELLFFLVIVTNCKRRAFLCLITRCSSTNKWRTILKAKLFKIWCSSLVPSRVSACPVAMKLRSHLPLQWHQLNFVFQGLSALFVLCQVVQRAGDAVPLTAGACSPISSLPGASLRCWRGTGRKVVAGTENLVLWAGETSVWN